MYYLVQANTQNRTIPIATHIEFEFKTIHSKSSFLYQAAHLNPLFAIAFSICTKYAGFNVSSHVTRYTHTHTHVKRICCAMKEKRGKYAAVKWRLKCFVCCVFSHLQIICYRWKYKSNITSSYFVTCDIFAKLYLIHLNVCCVCVCMSVSTYLNPVHT